MSLNILNVPTYHGYMEVVRQCKEAGLPAPEWVRYCSGVYSPDRPSTALSDDWESLNSGEGSLFQV